MAWAPLSNWIKAFHPAGHISREPERRKPCQMSSQGHAATFSHHRAFEALRIRKQDVVVVEVLPGLDHSL